VHFSVGLREARRLEDDFVILRRRPFDRGGSVLDALS